MGLQPLRLSSGELTQSYPALRDPKDYSPPGSSVHGDSPGKDAGVSCRFLLQGIFLTQGSNLSLLPLLHWQTANGPNGSLSSLVSKRVLLLPAMWQSWFWSPGREDALEKEMATHSSILAWRIP